jgi:hypothetical protein
MDYRGDDAGFIELIKDRATQRVGTVVIELICFFNEDFANLTKLLKPNISEALKRMVEKERAILASVMGVPPILSFVEASYQQMKRELGGDDDEDMEVEESKDVDQPMTDESEPVSQPVAVVQASDEPLSQALAKCASADQRKALLMERYKKTLAQDQDLILSKIQRPTSRAYKALDLNGQLTINEAEEKLSMGEHYMTKAEKAIPKPEYFKARLTEALHNSGRYKAAIIDSEMKKINPEVDLPAELRKAYFDMLVAGVKSRLASDQDYKSL